MTTTITPEALERVAAVAEHIERSIEYIDKAYPSATMLDRGPIITNMRRWAKKLRDAAPVAGEAAQQAGQNEKWSQSFRCGCFLGFPTKAGIPRSCPQHMRDRIGPAYPLAATSAPAAVPVDALQSAVRVLLELPQLQGALAYNAQPIIDRVRAALATNPQPAAQGVDLAQFRKPVEFWMHHSKAMMGNMKTTADVEGPRLLDLIDSQHQRQESGKAVWNG